jgi:hypothetical protein
VAYQVAGEATISFNRRGGDGVGATAGIELFLPDLMPSLFDKPVLSSSNNVARVQPVLREVAAIQQTQLSPSLLAGLYTPNAALRRTPYEPRMRCALVRQRNHPRMQRAMCNRIDRRIEGLHWFSASRYISRCDREALVLPKFLAFGFRAG